jgi:hypothetical protein
MADNVNLYYLNEEASADTVGETSNSDTVETSSTENNTTTSRNDTSNMASRLETVEKYVSDLRENTIRKDSDANLNSLTIKDRLTAWWGKVGGWLIDNGKLSTPNMEIDSNNQWIKSTNYQTGTSGFKISSDLVEAENLIARGTLRGFTFSYDHISAVSGQLMVANADTLAEDMNSLDSCKMKIKGDTVFADPASGPPYINDFLVMRNVATSGIQEEWMKITAKSGNTYTVLRDLAGSFATDANPTWKAGTPVVKQGSLNSVSAYSGGWLRLYGEGTNSPYYSVYVRTGVAYNDYSEVGRMGNLNGIGSFATDTYGIFFGNSGTQNYMQYDTSSGELVVNDSPISNQDIFGDGNNGDVTISGDTTLTSDMYYNNLTINNTKTLNTGGYRIFVKGTLTNDGTISRNGNNGGNGADAGSGAYPFLPGFGAGGTAGAALSTGTIYGSVVGGAGADGKDWNGNTSGGNGGNGGTNSTESIGVNGLIGGAGGGPYSGYAGGAGGAAGTATATIQPIRNSTFALLMKEFSSDNTVKYIKSSASSGGGGSGAGGGNLVSSGGGGGGGSAGGIILICAKKIVNNGTISANGGSGGNGGNSKTNQGGNACGAGGGSGGSGGIIVLLYSRLTAGTISVAGGTKGNKGLKVGSGTDGNDGSDGLTGKIIYLQI